jgi:hypothetical protein
MIKGVLQRKLMYLSRGLPLRVLICCGAYRSSIELLIIIKEFLGVPKQQHAISTTFYTLFISQDKLLSLLLIVCASTTNAVLSVRA